KGVSHRGNRKFSVGLRWKVMRTLSCFAAMTLVAGLAGAQPALRLKTLKSADARPAWRGDRPLKTRTLGRSHFLIQFDAGPSDDQVAELAARGATVVSYVPDAAVWVIAKDDLNLAGLQARWVGRLRREEKISLEVAAQFTSTMPLSALVEFHSDVTADDARAIANSEGAVIRENPDLLSNHLLIQGSQDQLLALA